MALKVILLPSELKTEPIVGAQQYLELAFSNASMVWLVGKVEDVRQLPDMTWGLLGFRHQHADKLILLCIVSAEA